MAFDPEATPSWPPNQIRPGGRFDLGSVGFWLLVFASVSFLTAAIVPGGTTEFRASLSAGAVSAPIVTTRPNTLIRVEAWQPLGANTWSFPELQLLDEDQEYLFSFGDETWHETGRDEDGPWAEAQTTYALDFRIPEPGTYYLGAEIDGEQVPVTVTVQRLVMSHIPHFVAALVALLSGFVLASIANGGLFEITDDEDD